MDKKVICANSSNNLSKIGNLKFEYRTYVANALRKCNSASIGDQPYSLYYWNIKLEKIIKAPVKYSLFADDLHIFSAAKNIINLIQLLQQSVNEISKWIVDQGLTLSKEKTEYIIFANRKHPTSNINLILGDTKIKQSKTINILGVIFDQKITWKTHITELKARCHNSLIMKMVGHKNWEADKKHLKLLYSSMTRSKVRKNQCFKNWMQSKIQQSD